MVANAMGRYDLARTNMKQEAGAVGDIFRLGGGLAPEGRQIQEDCLAYTKVLVGEGWEQLKQRKMNESAWNPYGQVGQDVLQFSPHNDRENNIHAAMLEAVTRLGNKFRSYSILDSASASLSPPC